MVRDELIDAFKHAGLGIAKKDDGSDDFDVEELVKQAETKVATLKEALDPRLDGTMRSQVVESTARRASVGIMDAGRALSGKLERSASSGARRMSTSASAARQRLANSGKLGSGKLSSRKDSEEDLA